MKHINWSSGTNQHLMEERGLSFEDVVFYMQRGALLDDIDHSNREKYPDHRVFVLDIDGYVYLILYVEDSTEIYLKTAIPSSKATKHYLGELNDEN